MTDTSLLNFRDFGGYPAQDGRLVKRGLLYRSGSLAHASPADLEQLAALGLRLVCDLRTPGERRRNPDRLPGPAVEYVHFPIQIKRYSRGILPPLLAALFTRRARRFDYVQISCEAYQEYVTGMSAQFSALLKRLAQPGNLPLLIHCVAGKDRTGFACALVQGLLGVPQERIMQEYLLSNHYLHDFQADMLRRFAFLARLGISPQQFMPLFEVRPAYLQSALDAIRRDYGTLDEYARRGLDFSDEERRRLGELLLE
jgi:protein-tyrosine phosphatase